jgi:hypothetical protein
MRSMAVVCDAVLVDIDCLCIVWLDAADVDAVHLTLMADVGVAVIDAIKWIH